ncbi:hypothetical protein BV898_04183 [Hypsibius exemplaris]|uniref:Ig-like domain-containing protein n=1 Tax=Hypsibius exemplaris TaxID=2072580 RepID=A0A1W0X3V1_HYPEX|nr:hypothetical protein BV898_04183 [Hypsibius exemplaris]
MSAPKFDKALSPRKSEVIETSGARFSGKVSGNPKPTVQWFKNDEPLTINDARHSKLKIIAEDDGTVGLNFIEAAADDDATYKCVASNQHGKAESQVDLLVEAMPDALKAATATLK